MNLRKLYFSIIRRAKENPNIGEMYDVYTEEHHILPISIYGQNKKTVVLTAREHVFVHHLLWRYFKKVWGEKHPRTIKMLYAINKMIYIQNKEGQLIKINSKEYQKIREEWSKNISGVNHPLYGKLAWNSGKKGCFSNETINKMSLAKKNKSNGRIGSKHPLFGKCGELSPNWNRKNTPEACKNISNGIKNGIKNGDNSYRTDKWKQKISDSSPNKKPVKRICLKTGEEKIYKSLHEVEKEGFTHQHVWRVCNGIRKTHRGYKWEYLNAI